MKPNIKRLQGKKIGSVGIYDIFDIKNHYYILDTSTNSILSFSCSTIMEAAIQAEKLSRKKSKRG